MKNRKVKDFFKNFRILKDPFALIFYVLMIVYVLSLVIPSLWTTITTFKDRLEFRFNRFGLPNTWTLENYQTVFSKMYITVSDSKLGLKDVYMPELMINGVMYAALSTLGALIMQTCVAYCCSKFKSLAGRIIHAFVIVTMIMPITGSLPASILVHKQLGLYDNFLGVIFAQSGWGGGNFLIMCAAFKGVSDDYRDAAFLDGASQVRVFLTIMIPMVKTFLAAMFILGFIGQWNNYQTSMVYLPSMPTIAYGLFQFRYSSDSLISAIPMQITGCVIVMIPILILFIAFRNKIMGNLMMGGLKG